MAWAFDVPDAGRYQVSLFLREWWTGASDPGDRVFDVAVEGQVPAAFDDIDAASDFGFRNGGVVSTTVEVTDGTLDLAFLSETRNPMVNAITADGVPALRAALSQIDANLLVIDRPPQQELSDYHASVLGLNLPELLIADHHHASTGIHGL